MTEGKRISDSLAAKLAIYDVHMNLRAIRQDFMAGDDIAERLKGRTDSVLRLLRYLPQYSITATEVLEGVWALLVDTQGLVGNDDYRGVVQAQIRFCEDRMMEAAEFVGRSEAVH